MEFTQGGCIQARLRGKIEIAQHATNALHLRGERGGYKTLGNIFLLLLELHENAVNGEM